jgi:hypothetical protein
MVAGDGGIEGVDLLIQAFPEASVGVAGNDRDLIHRLCPSRLARQRT